MRIAVLDPNNTQHWMEAHKAGCQHLGRRTRYGGPLGEGAWEMEADSLTEAAEEIASDFINEESMTVDQALESIHFAPCVKLPIR